MHPRLRKLWINWSLLALGTLLAMVLGLGWLAQRAADRLAEPELKQTAQLIGRAVAADIERALSYQIPLDKLVAVGDWFTGLVNDNAMLDVLVLTDANNKVLANVGAPDRLLEDIAESTGTRTAEYGTLNSQSMYVDSLPLHARDGQLIGWLHVGSVAPPMAWRGWGWTLFTGLALAAVAALLLRRLVRNRLQAPIDACRTATETLADGMLPLLSNRSVRDPATQYQSLLSEHLHALRRRNDALLLKVGEVRAAHFDPSIVQTLEDLAQPLAARQHQTTLQVVDQATTRRGGSAQRRALLATIIGAAVLVACALGLHAEYRHADQRQLLGNGAQLLQQAWQAVLDQDLHQLDDEIDKLLAQPGFVALLNGDDAKPLDDALEDISSPTLALAVFGPDGTPRAASGQRDETTRLDPLTLEPLRRSGAGPDIHGVWQNAAHAYQSGLARRLNASGTQTAEKQNVIMAARPLDNSVARLRTRLQAAQAAAQDAGERAIQVAVADLRGQPLADADAALVHRWIEHGRRNVITGSGDQTAMIISLGLNAPSGHALGTLLAQIPMPPQLDAFDNIIILLCLAIGALCLVTLLLYLRAQFVPLALATRQLERLADGDTDEEEPVQQNRESRVLYRVVRRIGEKIDALEMLRRSRDRQGKRQARFIRLQMMELAERLDEAARQGILEDLERIEHASRPQDEADEWEAWGNEAPANPRLERIVDEFGVLALGFQNLVSRVGQQYEELDRLVIELREALRTKTQFIALQQELEIARKMQLSILPREFSAHPALSLHATMQPAKEVGGDFYDFFSIDEHRVALVVADVSGKGVPAAFFMAISRTLLRAVAPYADNTAACITRVNDLLAADNEEMMFVTLFYAILDTRDGTLTYTNAGHNPPYLLRAGGGVEPLTGKRCIALAVADNMPYTEASITLQPGDGLFLYTDGITEAADPSEMLFGEHSLATLLEDVQTLPVEDITAQVVDCIKRFEAGGPQADDITCLAARFRSAP